ncbi:MAG: hypothetical protein IKI07_01550 [Prevotella sp.]|nr:hypothetical protein [Prevotella sp.]
MGTIYHGAIGRVRGSIGNTTYRRIYGKTNESAVYDKVLEVANPKTANQILQRAKMAPAQKFYEAFKSVLDHSRQGLQAGEITRRAFMSEVMKKEFRRWSYVPKGFPGVVPSQYPISKGSLPAIGQVDFVDNVAWAKMNAPSFPGIKAATIGDNPVEDFDTVADVILANNPNRFQVGDELTFLFVVSPADVSSDENVCMSVSIVLDPNVADGGPIQFGKDNNGDLLAYPMSVYGEDTYVVAAACIHSRKIGTSWQYSTEAMALEQDYLLAWSTSRAYREMMASYGAAGYNDANSRRQLQQATNQQYNGNIGTGKWYGVWEGDPITYLLSTTQVVSAGKQAQPIVSVFADGNFIIGTDGQKIQKPGAEQGTYISLEDIGWAGSTVDWRNSYVDQIPLGI